ncbi:MAG: hypothetical protein AAF527_06090 [Pseudomonadota bacterium]
MPGDSKQEKFDAAASPGAAKAAARQERLEAALRENLHRRKAAARRGDGQAPTDLAPAPPTPIPPTKDA